MPKVSPDGRYILNTDTLGSNAIDWGWLDAITAIGYRYDVTPNGLYTANFASGAFAFLGDYESANRVRFFASTGEWLVDLTTGPLDSDGTRWDVETRSAVAIGDLGERVFVRKPDFAALVINRGGVDQVIAAPGFKNSSPVTMRHGFLMYDGANGPTDLYGNRIGPHGAMQTFAIGPDDARWCCGYVADWGLCLWPWGAVVGLPLSMDGRDFYPDVFVHGDGTVSVASSETQGDTLLRLYHVRVADGQVTLPDGTVTFVTPRDLSKPPTPEPPIPPIPPIPPDPPIPPKPPDPPIPPIPPRPPRRDTSTLFFLKGR